MYTYKLKLLLLINKIGHKRDPRIGQFKASTVPIVNISICKITLNYLLLIYQLLLVYLP